LRHGTAPVNSDVGSFTLSLRGSSAAFRRFFRDELMPQVKRRYRTTSETAVVGESLAGLFVVEPGNSRQGLTTPDIRQLYRQVTPFPVAQPLQPRDMDKFCRMISLTLAQILSRFNEGTTGVVKGFVAFA
jgi:hypothetical protein